MRHCLTDKGQVFLVLCGVVQESAMVFKWLDEILVMLCSEKIG
jgi:hypothetical protein